MQRSVHPERLRKALRLLAWALGLGVLVYAANDALARMLVARTVSMDVAPLPFTTLSFVTAALRVTVAVGIAGLARAAPHRGVRAVLALASAAVLLRAGESLAMNAIRAFELIRDDGTETRVMRTLVQLNVLLAAASSAALFGALAFSARATGRSRGAWTLLVVGALAVFDIVGEQILPGRAGALLKDALHVLVPAVAALALLRGGRLVSSPFSRARRAVHLLVALIAGRVALGLAGLAVLALASRPPPSFEVIALAQAVFPAAAALLGIPLLWSLVQLSRMPAGRGARAIFVVAALLFLCTWLAEGRIVWLQTHEYVEGIIHGWVQRELDLLAALSLIGGALGMIALSVGFALLGDPRLRRRSLHLAAAAACAGGLPFLIRAWPLLALIGLWGAAAFVATVMRASALFRERAAASS